MACKGCEQRKQWLQDKLNDARESTRELLKRLSKANVSDSRAEQHTNKE